MITDSTDRRTVRNIIYSFMLISRDSEEPGEGQVPSLEHLSCDV